jgi:hypothetical protein
MKNTQDDHKESMSTTAQQNGQQQGQQSQYQDSRGNISINPHNQHGQETLFFNKHNPSPYSNISQNNPQLKRLNFLSDACLTSNTHIPNTNPNPHIHDGPAKSSISSFSDMVSEEYIGPVSFVENDITITYKDKSNDESKSRNKNIIYDEHEKFPVEYHSDALIKKVDNGANSSALGNYYSFLSLEKKKKIMMMMMMMMMIMIIINKIKAM